jgi:hypothetical protein
MNKVVANLGNAQSAERVVDVLQHGIEVCGGARVSPRLPITPERESLPAEHVSLCPTPKMNAAAL